MIDHAAKKAMLMEKQVEMPRAALTRAAFSS
jgi:hypothetical protein